MKTQQQQTEQNAYNIVTEKLHIFQTIKNKNYNYIRR